MENLVTRRTFGRTAAAAAAGAVLAPHLAIAAGRPLRFTIPGELPLLLAGQSIAASVPLEDVQFFKPLFGADRAAVNPGMPATENDGCILRFREPGEYYLRVNGRSALKVVVFAPDEGLPASLLRLFDFCVANNLYHGSDDQQWYRGHDAYLRKFFFSETPSQLLCGPTHQFFRLLVEHRFGLPSRVASGVGTFFENGQVAHRVHNVPEIYVPDFKKWVFFDLNFGWMPKWLDAFEVAEATRSFGPVRTDGERLSALGFDLHQPMAVRAGVPGARHGRFREDFVGNEVTDADRAAWARAFFSGAGYWGGAAQLSCGTDFLPNHYNLAMLHDHPALEDAAAGVTRRLHSDLTPWKPPALRKQLVAGHAAQIAQRAWRERFPA